MSDQSCQFLGPVIDAALETRLAVLEQAVAMLSASAAADPGEAAR